jgi:hypothetical protein
MQFGMIGWYVPLSMYPAGYGVSKERFRFSGFQSFSISEGHMANYQAARALMGKGNSEGVRERGSGAKKGAKKSAVKTGKPKK